MGHTPDTDGPSLIENLEEFLGIPFRPKYTARIRFPANDVAIIGNILSGVFGWVQLANKGAEEIRPALFRPKIGWLNLEAHMDAFPLSAIKQVLFYSDAVALDLMPIVGRCTLMEHSHPEDVPENIYIEGIGSQSDGFSELRMRINEFAELSDLVRQRLVLPFVGREVGSSGPIGKSYDPLFDTLEAYNHYVEHLRKESTIYNSSNIRHPFYSTLIFQVPGLNRSSFFHGSQAVEKTGDTAESHPNRSHVIWHFAL